MEWKPWSKSNRPEQLEQLLLSKWEYQYEMPG